MVLGALSQEQFGGEEASFPGTQWWWWHGAPGLAFHRNKDWFRQQPMGISRW